MQHPAHRPDLGRVHHGVTLTARPRCVATRVLPAADLVADKHAARSEAVTIRAVNRRTDDPAPGCLDEITNHVARVVPTNDKKTPWPGSQGVFRLFRLPCTTADGSRQ